MHRRGKKICLFRAVMTLLVFLYVCIGSINVYAYNADYLEESKWQSNNKVITMNVEKESNVHTLRGIFKYYADGEEGCLYTYFSVTESSIGENNEDVRIHYEVYTEKEEYSFSIDKNGMCDALEEEEKVFDVYGNFSTSRKTQEGMYITGVRIKEFEEASSIDVSIYINGHIYRIAQGIELKQNEDEMKEEEKSKAESSERTTGEKTAKTEKGTTKKAEAMQTTKYTPKGNTAEINTAYEYKQKESAGEGSEYETEETKQGIAVQSGNEEIKEGSAKAKMTDSAKALLFTGAGIAGAGAIFVAFFC